MYIYVHISWKYFFVFLVLFSITFLYDKIIEKGLSTILEAIRNLNNIFVPDVNNNISLQSVEKQAEKVQFTLFFLFPNYKMNIYVHIELYI